MIRLFLFAISIFVIFGCANQIPPDGGPIDKEPPNVIRTFPESGTIYYNKNFVEFEFNEYINKRTISNSIFVSPYFKDELEFKWSGKKLRINFPEKLKENKTYVVSLGTDITDLRGNNLAETITLRFSTGPQIDEGIISGKVFDEKPEGVMIFFYLIDTLNQIINYDSVRPDFVCQTSKDGSFYLPGLPNSIFRLIAVRDKMRNLLFDINEDGIGLSTKDFILTDTSKRIDNVSFELVSIDTIKPIVNSVKFEDLNHLRINFNEQIDLQSIPLDNFVLRNSLNNQIKLHGFYLVDKNSLMLVKENLFPNKDYEIEINQLKDLAGNEIDKTILQFFVDDIKDTVTVSLKTFECNFTQNVMEYFNPVCSLYFNDFVKYEDFINAIVIEDTAGKRIEFMISRTDSSNFILKFSGLKQKEKINLKIDLGLIRDLSGNRIDTILRRQIETNSESDYGSISGLIKNKDLVSNLEIEAKDVNRNKSYKVRINGEKYLIKNVLPGSYLLRLSIPDEIKSKNLIGFSKPFIYYNDTIKVKSRWPTTDVNFDVKDLLR